MNLAKSFFLKNNIPFEQMTPIDVAATTGWGLEQDSEAFVIYLPEGGKGKVTLPPGTYSIQWFDPRMGEMYTTGKPVEVPKSEMVWLGAAPHDSEKDWVVWVSRN